MLASHSVPEKTIFRALIAFVSLKVSFILLCSVALLVVLLYVLSLLLSALFDVCQQIMLTWAGCSPVEKLAAIFLVAILVIWIARLYRSLQHAA
jgi:hypothetical protein